MRERVYSVYMMQSTSRQALYIGMTSDLRHRVWQHKSGALDGFTSQYKCHRLVYFETYGQVIHAIEREKQLKRWRREKKDRLVETVNPHWKDLSDDWFEEKTKGPSTRTDVLARDDSALKLG